ncbi:flagellar protein FlaG [Amphibacillus cookii]|uniref:flagellar protein FlaG n=1 Tax=Amphibacillus cookii TaxID=767787 RepID=UPI00195BC665|nr:flagellar protein FlaG [Amphibacillus cookii]MBM7541605.1 flagellar protein FlaG [Amphibacillus cookii]
MDVGRIVSGTTLTQRSDRNDLATEAGEKSNHQVRATIVSSNIELVDRVELESMVEGLNEFLEPVRTSIKFEMHEKLEKYYVRVVDSSTDEIIREIPPEQMLDMYAAMAEFMGLIVDEKI